MVVHRFILILGGYATFDVGAVPLQTIDAEKVAEALIYIYSRLGVPEEVLGDQGTQLTSDCMREVCCLIGMKQRVTLPTSQ
ncbi:reverse transcriptase [Plakobranchus ocellatus]|uniref:Reverse transcriptase n=1 Tax=Plakobranchus ocellatus TaxID=259542 RepID=A0AAV3Y7C5_9GAST|nr:reverse transcriptase [Plakobranchus ocellatus]